MFSFFGFLRFNRPGFFRDLKLFAAPPVVSLSHRSTHRPFCPPVGYALDCLLLAVLFRFFFDFPLLLGMLFSPAVGCALLDLLLVVVQVLRLCDPFRQSCVASFVDFFSPLALVAVFLSLFSVFWRRLLQHYYVAAYCSEVRLRHLQRHHSVCATS